MAKRTMVVCKQNEDLLQRAKKIEPEGIADSQIIYQALCGYVQDLERLGSVSAVIDEMIQQGRLPQ